MSQVLVDENSSLTVVEPRAAESTKWSSCCQVIRDEFRLKNFCFDFDNEKVFYSSQWRLPRLVFVIFRVCLAIYIGLICLLSISFFPHGTDWPWLFFFTNWSYLLLTCHEIVAATIAVVHVKDSTTGSCCMELDDNENEDNEANGDVTDNSFIDGSRKSDRPKSDDSLPCYIKFSWLLFCVACSIAILLTMFVITFQEVPADDTDEDAHMSFNGFNVHILNGLIALIDVCLAAFPVRLYHVVWIWVYISIYFLFNYVYWTFDPTWNVIYIIMDWEDPRAPRWLIRFIIYSLIMQVILFAIYRIKILIYSKIFGNKQGGYEKI